MSNNIFSLTEYLKKRRIYVFGIIILLLLTFRLNGWSVTETSEARYAQISKEMIESNDFLHPQLMGIKHYHKPPMTYWITAASFNIFGINSFAARFPLQIAIVFQVFLVFSIARLLFKRSDYAFWTAMLYFSFPGVLISGRSLTTDAFLATFILFSILNYLKAVETQKQIYLVLFYVFLGMGFLTKGPVVLIVPIMVVLGTHFSGKKPNGKPETHALGLFLFFVTGLSWFGYLYFYDNRFLSYFLMDHTIERFATDSFSRSEPFWFFLVVIPAVSFPWTLLFVIYLFKFRKKDKANFLLYFFWVLIPVVFFSTSQSKLILYVLPVFSGISLGTMWVWQELDISKKAAWSRVSFIYHIVMLSIMVAAFLLPTNFDIPLVFLLIALFTLIGLVLIRIVWKCMTKITMVSAALFSAALLLNSTYFFSYNPEAVNDQSRVFRYIENNFPDTENLLVFNRRLPSARFLTGYNVVSLYFGSDGLNRETQFETDDSWKKNLLNLKEKPQSISEYNSPASVLISRGRRELPQELSGYLDQWERDTIIDKWSVYRFVAND